MAGLTSQLQEVVIVRLLSNFKACYKMTCVLPPSPPVHVLLLFCCICAAILTGI